MELMCLCMYVYSFKFVVKYMYGSYFYWISCDAVLASISIQEHAGNDKSCVWHANDFSDGELKEELFCIRFASVESELSNYDLVNLFS